MLPTLAPERIPIGLEHAAQARARARYRAMRRRLRRQEARNLIERFGRAHCPRSWDSARALARMLGAPDPGPFSGATVGGLAALLMWAHRSAGLASRLAPP